MNDKLVLSYLEVADVRVLAIMISFTMIAIFITRWPAMFSQSVVHWTSQDAVQIHLDPLHIPFSVDVLGEGSDTECDTTAVVQRTVVRCQLKSECECQVRLLWRVPFSQLSLLLNRITAADVLLYNCQTRSYDPGEHIMEAVHSGDEPREQPAQHKSHYPLVVVVETISPPEYPSSVVALLVVIHVRDAAAPMATGALYRYVRQADGRVTLLQPLYASGVEDGEGAGGSVGPLGTCCVCHEAPAAVVLLPCRHGCVCHHCFGRTATCPLCRGYVAQYFTVPAAAGAGSAGQQDGGEERTSAGGGPQPAAGGAGSAGQQDGGEGRTSAGGGHQLTGCQPEAAGTVSRRARQATE